MIARDKTIIKDRVLSVAARNAATNGGVTTFGALADQFNHDRCVRWRNVGPKITEEYRVALADMGLLDIPVDPRACAVHDEARANPGGFAIYIAKGGAV